MDISTRLIKINICAAIVFAAYFYLQTCDMYLQALSFFVTVPIAKNVLDCMLVPVQIENGRGYPVKKLFVNFLKCGFGVYGVITIEMIRRIAYWCVINNAYVCMAIRIFFLCVYRRLPCECQSLQKRKIRLHNNVLASNLRFNSHGFWLGCKDSFLGVWRQLSNNSIDRGQMQV